MKYLYRLYTLFVGVPFIILWTLFIAITVTIGCTFGNGRYWGSRPGKWWGWGIIRILLLPVKVTGAENLDEKQSYVFVANHQGAFDIFLVYGFLPRDIKWMMKYQLTRIPFFGTACKASHQILIDKRGASKIRRSYEEARETLKDGISLVVFPEGSRTFTGHMGTFRRGAFMLADELQLPVVPLTINGSFDVMSRTRDLHWPIWHPLSLTIHEPIMPTGKGPANLKNLEEKSYQAVMSSLAPEYQGFVENPDQ